MASVKEIYEKLGEMMQDDPNVAKLELCACGTASRLNVFRDDPDGPITGLSLEDALFMEGPISMAKHIIERVGKTELPERYMDYLIEMDMNECSEEDMMEFAKHPHLYPKRGSEHK